jgi:hypothetical protein
MENLTNVQNLFAKLQSSESICTQLKEQELAKKKEIFNKILLVLDTEYCEIWNLLNNTVDKIFYHDENNKGKSIYFRKEINGRKEIIINRENRAGLNVFNCYSLGQYNGILKTLKDYKENIFKALEDKLNQALINQDLKNDSLSSEIAQAKEEFAELRANPKTYRVVITIIEV